MPEEEKSIEITPVSSEPSSESIQMQISPAVNSREKAADSGKPFSERQEPFHPVKHKNRLSDADMEAYFKLSDDLDLFHSHEKELLQEYYRDKDANNTLTQEFCYKQNLYNEAWRKFNINLKDKEKSILAIHRFLDDISDSRLRENFEKELRSLLESQKMMDFAREKLCRHFHAIQLDELIAQIKDGMDADAMRQLLGEITKTLQLHTEKLDQWHEFSKKSIIMQEEIKGLLPPGGIRLLKKLATEIPAEKLKQVIRSLTRSGITEDMWELFWMNWNGMNNYDIAKRKNVDQSTIFRRMNTLKDKLVGIDPDLGNLLIKYGTTTKQAKKTLDESGVGEYSRKASRIEEDGEDEYSQ